MAPGPGRRPRLRQGALAGDRPQGRVRGLHTIVPRERFDAAVGRFEEIVSGDLVAASRSLFFDLLQPLADEAGKPVLVEMSCFTIAAADGLAQIFPEARFVHSVRDGRDSGSSKVSLRQKPHHPTDVALRDRVLGRPPAPGRGGGAAARPPPTATGCA